MWLRSGVIVLLYLFVEVWPRHLGRGMIPRFAKSNRRPHLTLSQSGTGVVAPSWWRREKALGTSAGGCARCQSCSAAIRTRLLAGLPTPDWSGWAGWLPRCAHGVGAPRLERGMPAGGEWLRWCPPEPSHHWSTTPGGGARHRSAPAAAAAAATPGPGPGASQEEETKTWRRRSASHPDATGSVTRGESLPNLDWGGGRRGEKAGDWKKQQGIMNVVEPCPRLAGAALSPPRCESEIERQGGGWAFASGDVELRWECLAPPAALACLPHTLLPGFTLRMLWPHSFSGFPNYWDQS